MAFYTLLAVLKVTGEFTNITVLYYMHVEIITTVTLTDNQVYPVHIEDVIKSEISFLSNVMLIGDKKLYLTCLVTLKVNTCLTSKRLV